MMGEVRYYLEEHNHDHANWLLKMNGGLNDSVDTCIVYTLQLAAYAQLLKMQIRYDELPWANGSKNGAGMMWVWMNTEWVTEEELLKWLRMASLHGVFQEVYDCKVWHPDVFRKAAEADLTKVQTLVSAISAERFEEARKKQNVAPGGMSGLFECHDPRVPDPDDIIFDDDAILSTVAEEEKGEEQTSAR